MHEQVDRLIGDIKQAGIPINPSSRLNSYAGLLKVSADHESISSVDCDYALLELLQLRAIIRELSKPPPVAGWESRFRKALKGAVRASEDGLDSAARSTQAELWTAAVLRSRGYSVELSEPDLNITAPGGSNLQVAVKRPRSQNKVRRNTRDAVKQLERRRGDGLIVLDLTYLEACPKPLYVPRIGNLQVPARIMLDGYASEYGDRLLSDTSEDVGAILLHLSLPCRALEPPAVMISRRWLLLARDYRIPYANLVQNLATTSESPG